jgi:tetratricopeptide (TPR) repeat protein
MAQSFRALEELELADIKGKLDIYYGGLLSGAKRFGGHLSAALDSVDVRLEEYSLDKMASKEMAELCRRWGARLEPGRARFFADDVARREAFSVALDAYAKEMERDQLAELTRQNKLKNLHALPFRIQHLQDMGDVAALEVLQQALSEDPEASAYQPLISATICKLRQEPEAALQALLPVLEQPESPVLEQSFAMMVGLCTELGQYQAVMDAMAGLASLNAYYLNFYADALAANGQIGDAIEHLTEYLHYFPRDKQAVIKLMSWYEEQDNKEGVGLAQTLLKQLMQEE